MLLAVLPVTACSDHGRKDKEPDSLTEEALDGLMRSIAEGKASAFASMCDYPLPRPYPLRAIEDSAMMVDYFPVMVDDSLRQVMKNASSDDWECFGWRGWTLPGREYVWYDGGVQYVTYESEAEKGLRSILAREELETLNPEYREGWSPVSAMTEREGGKLFRIDSSGDSYRLMQFEDAGKTGGNPDLLLTGTMHREGSAQLSVYCFGDSTGVSVTYIPDGEEPLRLWFCYPDGAKDEVRVIPGYWRDYVKFGKSKENQ